MTHTASSDPSRRFVIVVRADPVVCGHSVEARNLAEAALQRGYDDVRIITWTLERIQEVGLPLKPLDRVSRYSQGITVERPKPVGGYKVPDGRHTTGIVGRLVELFTDGVPTVCMSLYLHPHAMVVQEALASARATGLPVHVTTIAEAVGSDITDTVRLAVSTGRLGVAAHIFATYLANDHCVAVSDYTRQLIVAAAEEVDESMGTSFAAACRERVRTSYPAIDAASHVDLDDSMTDRWLAARGLVRGEYVLFLSRLTDAKGVDDLIRAWSRSWVAHLTRLVIAGNGPAESALRHQAAHARMGDRIHFLQDVSDEEKPHLMRASAAYVLPSRPRPEFVETFGIALVEQMLTGTSPVVTTSTGGIPEAVGDAAVMVEADDPVDLRRGLEQALSMDPMQRASFVERAQRHAMQFDRLTVFDSLMGPVEAAFPEAMALPPLVVNDDTVRTG